MLTLRQIEVIRAIMVTGSIAGAARLLNVAARGISRLMKYSEGSLGVRLFCATPERDHALFLLGDWAYPIPYGSIMMPEKPPKSQPGLSALSATDLARAAAQAGAAQNLAKQLAAINAPIDALKKAIPVLPRANEITKAHQTAADLAKALSRYDALSDLTRQFALPAPKVNLNLPDMSRAIQASLPRPLPDLHLRDEGAAVADEPRTASRATPP